MIETYNFSEEYTINNRYKNPAHVIFTEQIPNIQHVRMYRTRGKITETELGFKYSTFSTASSFKSVSK